MPLANQESAFNPPTRLESALARIGQWVEKDGPGTYEDVRERTARAWHRYLQAYRYYERLAEVQAIQDAIKVWEAAVKRIPSADTVYIYAWNDFEKWMSGQQPFAVLFRQAVTDMPFDYEQFVEEYMLVMAEESALGEPSTLEYEHALAELYRQRSRVPHLDYGHTLGYAWQAYQTFWQRLQEAPANLRARYVLAWQGALDLLDPRHPNLSQLTDYAVLNPKVSFFKKIVALSTETTDMARYYAELTQAWLQNNA